MEKIILYCDTTGGENTDLVLAAAKKRAKELKIRDVVVATTHGGTAIKVKEIFADPKLNLVAVGIAEGYRENGWCFTEEEKKMLEKAGIKPLVATHALGDGVASSFTEKGGGKSIEEMRARANIIKRVFWFLVIGLVFGLKYIGRARKLFMVYRSMGSPRRL